MIKKLTQLEVEARLVELSGWELRDGKLHRTFKFANFVGAFGFMASVALLAEKADHHPEWFNLYGTVRIDLNTHEVSGISERDFQLAAAIDWEFARLAGSAT